MLNSTLSKGKPLLPLQKCYRMTMNLDEMQLDSQAFWDQCESEAAKLEISVDYYLMEFVDGFQLNTSED